MHFLKRSDMAIHSFTCKQAFTPQPQHITARPLVVTHFTVPGRVEGWVDLDGWLHTEIRCRPRESNPDTVTHPSTNRAQRRLTSLIKTNALSLRQTTIRWHPEKKCTFVSLHPLRTYSFLFLNPKYNELILRHACSFTAKSFVHRA